MTWGRETPTRSGWYWYREHGVNLDFPMSAYVFGTVSCMYVTLLALHSDTKFQEMKPLSDYHGEWCGPLKVPE